MAKKSQAYIRLEKEYRKLAKKADQRLVRLEKLSQEENFGGILQYAYARAIHDVKIWNPEAGTSGNKVRFNTKPPENTQSLKAKIADIKNFLAAKTSTKTGIIESYKQKAETFSKKFGSSMDWQTLANFYRRGIAGKFEKYGYGAFRAIAVIQENKEKIQKMIKQNKEVDDLVEDDVLQERISDMLKHHKKDLKKLGVL